MTDQAPKAASKDAAANDLIAKMREVAKGIAAIGDDFIKEQESAASAMTEAEEARQQLASAEAERDEASGEVVTWREAIEDFRRGILDRDELFERTVGHG